MTGLLWLAVIASPTLAALALWRWPEATQRWIWVACLPAFAASLLPPPMLALGPLWPGAAWGAENNITQAWLGFSAVLWACASRFAVHDLTGVRKAGRFWLFWLLAMTGNFLLIMAQDVASFYVGFTMMSLSAYGLIVHLPGAKPRQAGRLYVQLAVLGEMLIYAGIMLRVHEAGGTLMLADLQDLSASPLAAALLLIGFGIKAGFWPLHVWLPLAHPAAPAAASAVLSGAMLKAGILGIWQFLPADDPMMQSWSMPLLIVAVISMFYGVALGMVQTKAKTVLAYSSISQIGYLVAIIALAWQTPDERHAWALLLALYAVHHGLAKGALFMGAGLAARSRFGPLHWLLALVPALALAGLPLSSGGAAKVILKSAAADMGPALLLPLLSIGSVGTALLVFRALWLMRGPATSRPTPPQLIPWAVLCLCPLALPWVWLDMRQATLYSLEPGNIWSLGWPIVLALALAAIAWHRRTAVPAALLNLPDPARYGALRLKRATSPKPHEAPTNSGTLIWRRHERRINGIVRSGTVRLSAWIICILLFIGTMMAF